MGPRLHGRRRARGGAARVRRRERRPRPRAPRPRARAPTRAAPPRCRCGPRSCAGPASPTSPSPRPRPPSPWTPSTPLAARERRLAREAGARPAADAAADSAEAAALRTLDEDAYALETAHDYARGGLLDDAIAVLSARLPGSGAKADPMVAYTLGWLHERKGDRPAAVGWYRRGRELPPDYCFPFRTRGGRGPGARECGRPEGPPGPLLPRQSPLRSAARPRHRGVGALPHPRPRLRPRPPQPRLRLRPRARATCGGPRPARRRPSRSRSASRASTTSSTSISAWTRAPLAARLARLTESPETVASREITAGRLARVQVLMGRDDEALETLGRTRFHVWEGESGIHSVYVAARLERGRRLLAKGDAAAALEELRAALEVPAEHRGRPRRRRAPRRRPPPRRPGPRDPGPEGRGRGGLPRVGGRCRRRARGPLLDRPVAREARPQGGGPPPLRAPGRHEAPGRGPGAPARGAHGGPRGSRPRTST